MSKAATDQAAEDLRHAKALLRDISATLETVKERLGQIPETARLPEDTEEAMENLLSAIRALRRYR